MTQRGSKSLDETRGTLNRWGQTEGRNGNRTRLATVYVVIGNMQMASITEGDTSSASRLGMGRQLPQLAGNVECSCIRAKPESHSIMLNLGPRLKFSAIVCVVRTGSVISVSRRPSSYTAGSRRIPRTAVTYHNSIVAVNTQETPSV